MSTNHKSCHGRFDCLQACSVALSNVSMSKRLWKLKQTSAHTVWHLKNKGLRPTLKLALTKIARPLTAQQAGAAATAKKKKTPTDQEVLSLKPGELVEVKSEEEILATLDENGRHKGLLWMAGMRRFCGGRFNVYKRLDRILLESTGELRRLKNTVLLDGAVCDGQEFYGCDRSCFHYWREAWLRRVP